MSADLWRGRQWRMVYGPKDLETGTRKCRHAQRNPRMRHLPLPKAGLLVRCLTRDGTECCRGDGAQPPQRQARHQPDPGGVRELRDDHLTFLVLAGAVTLLAFTTGAVPALLLRPHSIQRPGYGVRGAAEAVTARRGIQGAAWAFRAQDAHEKARTGFSRGRSEHAPATDGHARRVRLPPGLRRRSQR